MAWDLNTLIDDADAGQTAFSALFVAVRDFWDGRVAGEGYTAGQRAAIRAWAEAQLAIVEARIAAIRAQFDANT